MSVGISENLEGAAKQFDRFTNKSRVARKLQDLLKVEPFNNQDLRGWIFPPLAEARKLWERHNGGHWIWHRDVKEWNWHIWSGM
jgi:hypothetical protein